VYFYYFHLTPYPIPADHSWVAGGTAYSDAVQYGHATPSRVVRPVAILIDGYQRVFYTYGPLFGLILLTGLGGVLQPWLRRGRLPRLSWSPRGSAGSGGTAPPEPPPRTTWSMLPWATAVVLLVFPIAVADFDYRYLLPVLPFACLAAGLVSPPPGSRPRPNRSPSRKTTSPARCPARSARASQPLPIRVGLTVAIPASVEQIWARAELYGRSWSLMIE
jgi:hypothetical protein